MKKIILIYAMILVCGVGIQLLLQRCGMTEQKAASVAEKQNTSGINPFTVATRVELVTYNGDRMEWWYDDEVEDKRLLKNGKLNIPADSIHSRTLLNGAVIETLHKALYTTKFCEDPVIAFCYEPRHMLLFYNSENIPFGYIEVCLSCGGGQLSEGFREIDFCPKRVEYLAALLRKLENEVKNGIIKQNDFL